MDPAWIATAIVIIINIFGWGMTFGRLNGRVKTLEETTQRHEKILSDGLAKQISDLSSKCAGLQATINTYIDLQRRAAHE